MHIFIGLHTYMNIKIKTNTHRQRLKELLPDVLKSCEAQHEVQEPPSCTLLGNTAQLPGHTTLQFLLFLNIIRLFPS